MLISNHGTHRSKRSSLLLLVLTTTAAIVMTTAHSTFEQHRRVASTSNNDTTSSSSQQSNPNSIPIPLNDNSIRNAINDWVTRTDKQNVITQYGHISDWKTEHVTDMSYLLTHARFFNEDLSRWDVSRVTDMQYMFAFASSFRGATDDLPGNNDNSNTSNYGPDAFSLRKWNTSRVRNMAFAFYQATAFAGEGLVEWDVRSVTDMTYMFQAATKFQENIWRWEPTNVRSMNRMFHNASRFNRQLCWYLNHSLVAVQMFCGTDRAGFSCDPDHVLESPINKQYYNCCTCEYSADELYYEDDAYGNGGKNTAMDQRTGIILTGCIWGIVFITFATVGYVTFVRRHQVRDWIQSTLKPQLQQNQQRRQPGSTTRGGGGTGNSSCLALDGSVIATFVGPAETITSATATGRRSTQQLAQNSNDDTINNDENVLVIGADHIQRQETSNTSTDLPAWWLRQGTTDSNAGGPSWWLPSADNNIGDNQDTWVHATATTVDLPNDGPPDPAHLNDTSMVC